MANHRLLQDYDDNDFYKANMKQVVFSQFPFAEAEYEYTNRDPNKTFRAGFADELREQFEMMSELRRTRKMEDFYRRRAPWLKPTFLEWERTDVFDPSQVTQCEQDDSGRLKLRVGGDGHAWRHGMKWEVPILSTVGELDHTIDGRLSNMQPEWERILDDKGRRLADAGIYYMEFGSRRRAAFSVQKTANDILRKYAPYYRGTSNPFIACMFDVGVHGTVAHEMYQAMQALYAPSMSNERCMHHWVQEFQGNLGIALPDTLTTEVFLRDFNSLYANLFQGVRQDSGDPIAFGEKVIKHYETLGIDPTTKIIVFSDALNVDKAIKIHNHFKGRIRITMGIGTNLTNDVGWLPCNHVMKLKRINFGKGWKRVYKLSDDKGKHSASKDELAPLLADLGLGIE